MKKNSVVYDLKFFFLINKFLFFYGVHLNVQTIKTLVITSISNPSIRSSISESFEIHIRISINERHPKKIKNKEEILIQIVFLPKIFRIKSSRDIFYIIISFMLKQFVY